jgi:hypothetical protein
MLCIGSCDTSLDMWKVFLPEKQVYRESENHTAAVAMPQASRTHKQTKINFCNLPVCAVPESTLQSDVISIAREHASGTHATGAVSGTATRSDRHPSQGAAAGTSAVSNSHNGTSRSYSSKVESAMATTVGVPYRISQPGTLIEEGNEVLPF